MTTFILLFFCWILMAYEAVSGVEGCSSAGFLRAGGRGAGVRWTDEGRWACPEDRLAGRTETKSDRKRGGRETAQRERESKTELGKKARAESEEEDMDQSQVKSKAHSLWKNSGETRVVSLNTRPCYRKESSERRILLSATHSLSNPIINICKVTERNYLEKVTGTMR